ncbi:hypothetical protein NC652_012379 [Populus alba x Populus x berolinensis]|nr:hypothetical protein NC652_012379 [Populus alba x Populus x berolinensis]
MVSAPTTSTLIPAAARKTAGNHSGMGLKVPPKESTRWSTDSLSDLSPLELCRRDVFDKVLDLCSPVDYREIFLQQHQDQPIQLHQDGLLSDCVGDLFEHDKGNCFMWFF